MGKRRQKRKSQKRASKYGVNPITGKPLTKREKRKADRFGYNDDGTINSKRQGKMSRKSKRQDLREQRIANKTLKIEGKNVAKENRTAGRLAKKEGKGMKLASEGVATEILAEQGIDSQANKASAISKGISDSVKSVGEVVSNIYGGGEIDEFEKFEPFTGEQEIEFKQPKADNSNNMLMYIVIAIAVFLGYKKIS